MFLMSLNKFKLEKNNRENRDILLLKFDSTGFLLWYTTWGCCF